MTAFEDWIYKLSCQGPVMGRGVGEFSIFHQPPNVCNQGHTFGRIRHQSTLTTQTY